MIYIKRNLFTSCFYDKQEVITMNKKTIYPIVLAIIFICIAIYGSSRIHLEEGITPIDYSVVLIGVVYLASGIYSYIQQPYTKIMKSYLLLMFVSAIAISLSVPASLNHPYTKEMEAITVSFAPFLLLQFFQYFPSTKRPKLYHVMRYISLTLSLFTIGSFFTYLFTDMLILNMAARLGNILNLTLSIFTCCTLLVQHLKHNSTKIRHQIILLIYGFFISFAPVLLFSLIPEFFLNVQAISFQYSLISIIMLPITLSYLFNKHDFIRFHINSKRSVYYFILFSLCSLLFYISSAKILHISINKAVYLNLLFLFGLIVFFIGKQFIETIVQPTNDTANDELETEKQMIYYQFLKNKHLEHCAELITKLIENVIDVKGVWIIWRHNDIPISLTQTGIFMSLELTKMIEKILKNKDKNTIAYGEQTFFVYPVKTDEYTIGWILLGLEDELSLENEDFSQMNIWLAQSSKLIASAQTLTQLKKRLQKKQSLFQTSNQLNHILLKELENKDKSLSQFLHDEVLQYLILLSNKIDMLHNQNQIDAKANEELKKYLKTIIHDIREMSHHLHPAIVEDLGLTLALKALKRKLEENHNVHIELNNHLSEYRVLSKELSIQIYSIIKELVHNAIKHSSSKDIYVSIQEEHLNQLLIITVEDNGVGFHTQEIFSRLADNNHLGLITVQQRVNQLQGVLEIKSKPNFGTSIVITVPIEWGEADENQSIISG